MLTPASPLSKGEYALYLTRGEGLSPYVYDFSVGGENKGTKPTVQAKNTPSVESSTNAAGNPSPLVVASPASSQQIASTPAGASLVPKARSVAESGDASPVMPGRDSSAAPSNPAGEMDEEASIGAWFYGKPTIRHDGVEVSGVQRGGAAEDIGIRTGDSIVSIDDHYLFTIQELHTELRSHPLGSRVAIRYRRNSLIYDSFITLGPSQP